MAAHLTLTLHVDSTNKDIDQPGGHFCRCIRGTIGQCDRLEVEIGSRLDRPAAMYSTLLFPRLMRISLWLASHPTAVSGVRFIVQATQGIHGLRWCLWTE